MVVIEELEALKAEGNTPVLSDYYFPTYSKKTVVNEEAEALKAEGNRLVGKKEYAKAAKKYKKATSIDPTCAAYWSNLAFCYDNMKDFNAFKEAAQKCVEADPTFIKGYKRLAKAQENLWEYEQAKETLERGLAIDINDSDILKMYKNIIEILEFKRPRLTKETLKIPTTTNLPFLGGLRPPDRSRIPPGTAYARFKRTPLPPMCTKQMDMVSQYSAKIRPVFEVFYNGDLRIEWLMKEKFIQIDGYVSVSDSAPVISCQYFAQYIDGNTVVSTAANTDQHQFYHLTLTHDQKQMLAYTLRHRFLRAKAAMLDHRDFNFMKTMAKTWVEDYNKLGMYKDSADLMLILADASLNRNSPSSTVDVIYFVEALEASKRFQIAGDIYVEISEATAFPRHRNCSESRSRGFAALAYKRAQKYGDAERQYVASLRAAGPNLNFNDEDTRSNLPNMMIFYETIDRAVVSGFRTDEAHMKMQKACHLMVGLLSIAGWPQHECCTLFKEKDFYQERLRPQFKSRKKAKEAVVAAIMAPSIDEYHKLLCSYQIDSMIFTKDTGPNPSLQKEDIDDFIKDQKMKSKTAARAYTSHHVSDIQADNCISCGKLSEDTKQCPCGVVKYCSKECQVVHWKQIHKKVCTARKSR